MYCKKCGFQLSSDARFCPNCGTKVELPGVGNIEQKAVFGKIEDDDTIDSESINSQAQWHCATTEFNSNGQTKTIRTKTTTEPRIFINYFSYENDIASELSLQWYVDEKNNALSEKYDKVSEIIDYDITFVKKNGKWACVKYENSFFREKTPFIFDKIATFRRNGIQCHLVYAQSTDRWKKWFNNEKIAEVESNGSRKALTVNMELYGIEQKGCFDFISNIVGLLITGAIVFGIAYGGSYIYDLVTGNSFDTQGRLIFAGIIAVIFMFVTFDSDDYNSNPYLVQYEL